jgi:protein-S-isoprenylcysteine O-methyltransferase Ste14
VAVVALVGYVVYLALAFGLRTAIQLRRTGSSGFHGISGTPGSAEWIGGVGFVVALALGFLAPVADLLGVAEPIDALDGHTGHVVGVVLFALGLAATLAAQFAMGESWRIGVSEEDRAPLVSHGPFALVRNPIFSAMLPAGLGLALMTPNVLAVAGVIALAVALEIQVRFVEEPYLLRTHPEYADYARRVGRFVPGVGRLRREGAER